MTKQPHIHSETLVKDLFATAITLGVVLTIAIIGSVVISSIFQSIF